MKESIGVKAAEEGIAAPNSQICSADLVREKFGSMYLKELDSEGRCIITDHDHFILFNLYCPNGDNSSERHQFKLDFCIAVQLRVQELIERKRNVVVVGDINICSQEIDHFDPLGSIKEHKIDTFGSTPSRSWFNNEFLEPNGNMIDSFRKFNPDLKGQYTVWNTKVNARPSNCGTRIDYTLVNSSFFTWVKDAFIMPEVLGSDHCPVGIELFNLHPKSGIDINSLLPKSKSYHPPLSTFFWETYPGKQKKLDMFLKPNLSQKDSPLVGEVGHLLVESIKPSYFVKNELYHSQENRKNTSKIQKLDAKKVLTQKQQPSISSFFKKQRINEEVSTITQSYKDDTQQTTLKPEIFFSDNTEDAFLMALKPSKEDAVAWKTLMTPKSVPECNHGEICKEFTCSKPGINKGRRFYICAQDFNKRCNFFRWK